MTVPGGTVMVCSLPATLNVSSTLPSTPSNAAVVYQMRGRVDVGTDQGNATSGSTNVVLTVEDGAVVMGREAVLTYMVVNRGNSINIVGLPNAPVIFTSEENVAGTTTATSQQQWGGLILLGRAPVSDCLDGGATEGTDDCEAQIEGTAIQSLYGGDDVADSSGNVQYVQFRFSGYEFAANNELQSLTTGGTGTGTDFSRIMSFNSSDDGVEFFGGYVNGKYWVVVGAGDDSFDTDSGLQAELQWLIAVQRTDTGNGVMEVDSPVADANDTPRQDLRISNATFLHQSTGSDQDAIRIRGGADVVLANSLVLSTVQGCFDADDSETLQAQGAGAEEDGAPFFPATYMQCAQTPFENDGNGPAAQTAFEATTNGTWTGNPGNSSTATITLTMNYENDGTQGTVWTPTPLNRNGFTFDVPTFIGAATSASTWYEGWTCDSALADFGSGDDCIDSPFS